MSSLLRKLTEEAIKEELLDEAAKTIQQADQEKMGLFINEEGLDKEFVLYKSDAFAWSYKSGTSSHVDTIVGILSISYREDCDAWMVMASAALKGYGPLLYDIGMSKIAPDFLAADRGSVSESAKKVWNYMLTVRANDFAVKNFNNAACTRNHREAALNKAFSIKNPVNVSSLVQRHANLFKKIPNSQLASNKLLKSADDFFNMQYDGQP